MSDEASALRHRQVQGDQWITQGRPDTCILASYDPESNTIGLGIALKRTEMLAALSMAQLNIDEALELIDELRDLVDAAILQRYRRESGASD